MNGDNMSLEHQQQQQGQQDQLHDQNSKEDSNSYLAALQLVQNSRWEALCLQYTPKLPSEKNSGESDLGQEEGGRGRPFQCSVCNATYKTRTHLRRHMFIHLSSRPFICNDCGKGFNRKEHLNKHIEAVHSGTKYECGYCGKEISRKDHLNRHIKNMHMSLTCTVTSGPGTGISSGEVTNAMMNDHDPSQVNFGSGQPPNLVKVDLPCGSKQKAQLSFLAPQQQQLVQAIAKPKKVQQPQVKQKAVPSIANGVNQQQLANSVKVTNHFTGNKMLVLQVYSCTECNATFTTEKDFNIHSRTHKPQPYKCAECPRAYTRREKLTEHIRCFHQGQKFTCDYCQKTLSRKDHVLRHVRSVHPEVLANRFVSMAEDMDAQSGTTNFNSSTPSSSTQQGSTASALGEMNILLRSVCHICLKVFGTSYHLSRHMESCHNGDIRPYNCTACSKQFKRKDHLTKHMKSHCPSFKKMNEIESNGIDAIDSLQILMHPDDDLQDGDSKMDLNDIFSVSGSSDNEKATDHKRMDVSDLYSSGGSTLESLTNGELSVSAITMYPCGHCGKEFTDRNKMAEHLQEHGVGGKATDVKINQSQRMDLSQMFGNNSTLEHLGNGNLSVTMLYPCGHCQKEFTDRDRLIQHLQEHTNKVGGGGGSQDKRLGVAHQYVNSGDSMDSHGSINLPGPTYPCGHCQKEFTDRNRLIQHLQEHNDANSYTSLMEACT